MRSQLVSLVMLVAMMIMMVRAIRNLEGITVTLDDGAGNVLTTTTDNSGNYIFEDITPGNYTITQTNDPNFVDVNDAQGANNDSQIAVRRRRLARVSPHRILSMKSLLA